MIDNELFVLVGPGYVLHANYGSQQSDALHNEQAALLFYARHDVDEDAALSWGDVPPAIRSRIGYDLDSAPHVIVTIDTSHVSSIATISLPSNATIADLVQAANGAFERTSMEYFGIDVEGKVSVPLLPAMSHFTLVRYFDLMSPVKPRIFADPVQLPLSPLKRLDLCRMTFHCLITDKDKDKTYPPIISNVFKGAAFESFCLSLVNRWMGTKDVLDGACPRCLFTMLIAGQHVPVTLISEVITGEVYVHINE